MSRIELSEKTTLELCELANVKYYHFRKGYFTRNMLIEIILTPND